MSDDEWQWKWVTMTNNGEYVLLLLLTFLNIVRCWHIWKILRFRWEILTTSEKPVRRTYLWTIGDLFIYWEYLRGLLNKRHQQIFMWHQCLSISVLYPITTRLGWFVSVSVFPVAYLLRLDTVEGSCPGGQQSHVASQSINKKETHLYQ